MMVKTLFSHYQNTPMQYKEIFSKANIEIFIVKTLIFKKHFHSNHRLWVPVRTASASTHNVRFGEKIRKIGIPLLPQFYYLKVGFKGYLFHGLVLLMKSRSHKYTEDLIYVLIYSSRAQTDSPVWCTNFKPAVELVQKTSILNHGKFRH